MAHENMTGSQLFLGMPFFLMKELKLELITEINLQQSLVKVT